jgi:hypothetical protein
MLSLDEERIWPLLIYTGVSAAATRCFRLANRAGAI